jgi:hypothetical protein
VVDYSDGPVSPHAVVRRATAEAVPCDGGGEAWRRWHHPRVGGGRRRRLLLRPPHRRLAGHKAAPFTDVGDGEDGDGRTDGEQRRQVELARMEEGSAQI